MKLFTFSLVAIFLPLITATKVSSKLSSSLSSSLQTASENSVWNIVIEMEDGIESVLQTNYAITKLTDFTRDEKASLLGQGLAAHATTSQKEVLTVLAQNKRKTKNGVDPQIWSSWISNSVFVRGADKDLILSLEGAPGVAVITEELVLALEVLKEEPVNTLANEWSIEKVSAPYFWVNNNHTGEGILVGHIDSGVRYTHTALRSNWVGGNGGWFAPRNSSSSLPYESSLSSHGTHTLATAVGADGIGVAPGAKWMSCLGCFNDNCLGGDLTACGEFMLCPNSPSQPNSCTGVPHIVSCSWGGRGGQNFYDRIIQSWRAVGIIPVFAAGNSGPGCGTVGSPGDNQNVISVGATTQDDVLANFSSVGPNSRGSNYKPDIVAPGARIRSAIAQSDTSFGELSGTSMAAPAVAGAVALLLSANPRASYATVRKELLEKATRTGLRDLNGAPDCGSLQNWPNNKFGYGRLNLINATAENGAGCFESGLVLALSLCVINIVMVR